MNLKLLTLTKHCLRCNENKQLEDFGLNIRKPDGKNSECKSCANKRASNRRRINNVQSLQEVDCLECEAVFTQKAHNQKTCSSDCYDKMYHRTTGQTSEFKEKRKILNDKWKIGKRELFLLKKYGLTPESYNQLFIKQEGKCAICSKHQTELNRRLYVDHCHKTGEVRGLLCQKCNSGIGMLGDSIEGLNKAIIYLRKAN